MSFPKQMSHVNFRDKQALISADPEPHRYFGIFIAIDNHLAIKSAHGFESVATDHHEAADEHRDGIRRLGRSLFSLSHSTLSAASRQRKP